MLILLIEVLKMAKVLVVDDSKFMRNIIRDSLHGTEHEVVAEAENGIDALDAYKESKPDVVTMDVTMWGKDGLTAVDEIVQFDPEAKIIMISALSENTMRTNKKDIKAKAFLTKPFQKEDLVELIEKII